MLQEVDKVFTDKDNSKLLSTPTQEEVRKVIAKSNLSAAPGSDGIPSLLYDKCWDTVGLPLTEVVQAVHGGGIPTQCSQALWSLGQNPKSQTL